MVSDENCDQAKKIFEELAGTLVEVTTCWKFWEDPGHYDSHFSVQYSCIRTDLDPESWKVSQGNSLCEIKCSSCNEALSLQTALGDLPGVAHIRAS